MKIVGPSLISDAHGLSLWTTREARTADPRQIDRELIVNAAEAGATTLLLHAVGDAGRELYVAADNGPGVVDPDRLRDLVRTMHLTTKDVGRNYGFGARLVSLARNPLGVTFASRQPAELVEGFEPREVRTPSSGRRRVVEFGVTVRPDAEGTYRLDADAEGETVFELEPPAFSYFNGKRFSETGYAVMLHGSEGESAWPGGHVIHRQIAQRFWRIPHDLDVRIKAGDKILSANPLAQRLEAAVLLGHAESGIVFLDEWPNVRVSWALLDEKQERASSPRDALTHGIAAELDGELFGWDRSSSRFDQFGISHRSVRQRLLLVVHVSSAADDPEDGYVMSSNRARLDRLDARPGKEGVSWAQYGAAFYEQMPDAIRDALRIRVSVSIGSGIDGVRDLFGDAALEELNRIVALTLDPEGEESAGEEEELVTTGPTGESGGRGDGSGGTSRTTTMAAEGIVRRARKRNVRPSPECEWASPDELDDDERAFLVRLVTGTERSARPTLIGNRGHGWYERVAGLMAAEFPLVDRGTLLEAVEATLGAAAIWVYLASARARREAVNSGGVVDSIEAFHSPQALTLGTMATSVPAVEPRLRELLLSAVRTAALAEAEHA